VSHALLITQCLQRDFVGAIGPHDPLPNALHVGATESARLLGSDPTTGPVAQLLHWARQQAPDALSILHLRDWHDSKDPRQQAHLDRFGKHCLRDTRGAELVLDLDAGIGARANERTVDSLTLNDFEDTDLDQILADLPRPMRVAVVGVWTEAKVTFLLYELATRCGLTQLATCSALTASASRSQHFNALQQLKRILGVTVFNSVGELASWLVPDGDPIPLPPAPKGPVPTLEGDPLALADPPLVGALYREATRLDLRRLGGGFSGADVFRVQAWDPLGHQLAPTVLKLGPRALIAQERVAFEQVEGILGNDAPSVRGFVDLGERAGLKYAFAAMGRGPVHTLKDLYQRGLPDDQLADVLDRVFDGILGRFGAAARYERLNLLAYYTFEARWADSVARKVTALLGHDPGDSLDLPGGGTVSNPALIYRQDLGAIDRAIGSQHFVAFVHGDLNGANILRDGQGNVWLIDFFHTHRGHAIRDLVKLENDLLYLFTPLRDQDELTQALALSQTLRGVADLAAPLPELPAQVRAPQLLRAWRVLRLLRARVAGLVHEDRDPTQLSVALLRYAAHTMDFDEASPLQRRWALYAAGGHTTDVLAVAARNQRLRVDWLPGLSFGLTICPGRSDRHRDLDRDLDVLAQSAALLCLLPDVELAWAGVPDLIARARARGIDVRQHPIHDQGVPDPGDLRKTLAWVQDHLDRGQRVVVHCMGGLGRSGLVAACLLVDQGQDADQAIATVRAARDPRAIETLVQERFVRSWTAPRPV